MKLSKCEMVLEDHSTLIFSYLTEKETRNLKLGKVFK